MKYQIKFENKVAYQAFGRFLISKHYSLYKKVKCENLTITAKSEKTFKEIEKLSKNFIF